MILLSASVSLVNTSNDRPTELERDEQPEAPEEHGRDIRTCGVREPSGCETIGTRSGKPSRSTSPIRRGRGKEDENVVSNSRRESEPSAKSEETSMLEKDWINRQMNDEPISPCHAIESTYGRSRGEVEFKV